jgi:predicted AAA+ superfamily ATPase
MSFDSEIYGKISLMHGNKSMPSDQYDKQPERCLAMNTTSLFPRWVEPRINEAMVDTPVVLVVGPRQAGKTTLVRQVASKGMRYLTLDDELTLLAAREDPVGFISSLDRAVID